MIPTQKEPPMTLFAKYEKYCENYPYVKDLPAFSRISPSENNHVYTARTFINFGLQHNGPILICIYAIRDLITNI